MSSSYGIVTTAVHPLGDPGPSAAWWEARHARGVLMLGDRTATFDVLTMGRIGVDVYPFRSGCRCARSPASASTWGAAQPTWPWPRPATAGAARSSPAPARTLRRIPARRPARLRGRRPLRHRRAGPADPRMEDTKTSTRTVVAIAA